MKANDFIVQYSTAMSSAVISRKDYTRIFEVPRARRITVTANISRELFERIEAGKGDYSRSHLMRLAISSYVSNPDSDTSYEDLTGDWVIQCSVSRESKAWIKRFCEEQGRSESWVAAKAIALYLGVGTLGTV